MFWAIFIDQFTKPYTVLNDVREEAVKLNEKESGLLKLIDIKIENDMEKILARMDAFTSRLDAFSQSTNSEFKRLEDKMDTQFKMLTWAFGIMMALMIALKLFS